MLLVTISVVILFILAIDNVYEFLTVYRVRVKNDKASMLAIHSRVVEAMELVGYVVAGILLYISGLNLVVVGIVVLIGIFHLPGVVMGKRSLEKMSLVALMRLNIGILSMTLTEVIVASFFVVWMAGNGLIGL